MIYLTLPEPLHVAEHVLGEDVKVRDHGLLESALALIACCGLNGRRLRLTLTNDAAYDLVVDVASGKLDVVPDIAGRLVRATRPLGRLRSV